MKPPTVDAEKWDGPTSTIAGVEFSTELNAHVVQTPNGPVAPNPGDYVVSLPNGQYTVSSGAQFERMFEPGE
jgi:hypothetical protein